MVAGCVFRYPSRSWCLEGSLLRGSGSLIAPVVLPRVPTGAVDGGLMSGRALKC